MSKDYPKLWNYEEDIVISWEWFTRKKLTCIYMQWQSMASVLIPSWTAKKNWDYILTSFKRQQYKSLLQTYAII